MVATILAIYIIFASGYLVGSIVRGRELAV